MRIIFFDIDGTLAIGKSIPGSAKKAVRILRENKDLVFICTGRNISYVRDNFSEFADGFICNNGRLACFNDEVIFDAPIDQTTLNIILKKLNETKAGSVFYTRQHGYYIGPEDLYHVMSHESAPGYLIKGLDGKDARIYNFDICFHDSEHYDRIREQLADLCILNPHFPHPSADVTVVGTDKGDAIKAIADKLGVDIADTFAFGDGINDICMMRAAGHGIAMGNALNPCKKAAEYVTSDIDADGVYNGLKHYGLI